VGAPGAESLVARSFTCYDGGMICCSLNSGSNGNCIYLEAEGVKLLFDAGISGKRTAERLATCGRDVRDVQAVIISHDHVDHIRCAGILNRKFGLPVYMTRQTYLAGRRYAPGPIYDLRHFRPGEALTFASVTVQTVRTPHDGAEPVAFVISDGYRRVGILTDLGHVFRGLGELLRKLDAVFLESNYDPQMLASGPYSQYLKRRIAGEGGHLSNVESAELVAGVGNGRLQWVALSHLSQVNNTPELARRTHLEIAGGGCPIHVAGRHGPSELLRVE